MKTCITSALIFSLALLISSGDEVSGSGLQSLRLGGVIFPLKQIAENVSADHKISEAYRLVDSSGFSLQDIVIVVYADGKCDVLWGEGVYSNVRYGIASLEQFQEQHDSKIIDSLLEFLRRADTWKFDEDVTGEAIDGEVDFLREIVR